MTDRVSVQRDGAVARVVYRNDRADVMDPAGLAALRRALTQLSADPSVRVVVLAGPAGRFPILMDPDAAVRLAATIPPVPGWLLAVGVRWLSWGLRTAPRIASRILDNVSDLRGAYANLLICAQLLEDGDAITVAAIDGPAFGGGMELALCCDLRLCSNGPRTYLAQPEILGSVMAGFGATQRLPRLVGTAKALELLLLAEALAPDEAMRIGLVNRVLPADGFDQAVAAIASRLAARSPAAAVGTKRAVRAASGRIEMGREAKQMGSVWRSEAAVAGLRRVGALLDQLRSGPRPPLPEVLDRFEGGAITTEDR